MSCLALRSLKHWNGEYHQRKVQIQNITEKSIDRKLFKKFDLENEHVALFPAELLKLLGILRYFKKGRFEP